MTQSNYGIKGRLQTTLGTLGLGLYSFLSCLLVMSIVDVVALITTEPMLFPQPGANRVDVL